MAAVAIQNAIGNLPLDCFAPLAMTSDSGFAHFALETISR
jgi:hypothetical protein